MARPTIRTIRPLAKTTADPNTGDECFVCGLHIANEDETHFAVIAWIFAPLCDEHWIRWAISYATAEESDPN